MNNLFIFSHRRSGTHLTIDSILNNFSKEFSLDKPINLDLLKGGGENVSQFIDDYGEGNKVLKSHSIQDVQLFFENKNLEENFLEQIFENSKKIYVYRDGRDVLVSLYHYQKKFDKSLAHVSFHEFIRQNNTYEKRIKGLNKFSRVGYWAYHVSEWLNSQDTLFLNFNELAHDNESAMSKVSKFTGLSFNNENFVNVSRVGGKRIAENVKSSAISFRSGKANGWVDEFNDSDLEFFYKEVSSIDKSLTEIFKF